jgi:hypothetical protein
MAGQSVNLRCKKCGFMFRTRSINRKQIKICKVCRPAAPDKKADMYDLQEQDLKNIQEKGYSNNL